jgi:hypothetical protein
MVPLVAGGFLWRSFGHGLCRNHSGSCSLTFPGGSLHSFSWVQLLPYLMCCWQLQRVRMEARLDAARSGATGGTSNRAGGGGLTGWWGNVRSRLLPHQRKGNESPASTLGTAAVSEGGGNAPGEALAARHDAAGGRAAAGPSRGAGCRPDPSRPAVTLPLPFPPNELYIFASDGEVAVMRSKLGGLICLRNKTPHQQRGATPHTDE